MIWLWRLLIVSFFRVLFAFCYGFCGKNYLLLLFMGALVTSYVTRENRAKTIVITALYGNISCNQFHKHSPHAGVNF